jgi:hypothetical protein
MATTKLDIGDTLFQIKKHKKFEASMHFEEKCIVETDDPKPLIKVFNYLINYLKLMVDGKMDISLTVQESSYLLTFIIMTDDAELPPLSDNLDETLQIYKAKKKIVFEAERYLQIILEFTK